MIDAPKRMTYIDASQRSRGVFDQIERLGEAEAQIEAAVPGRAAPDPDWTLAAC